jgi:hypothetical protein
MHRALTPVCTENLIRVDAVMESAKNRLRETRVMESGTGCLRELR